MWYLVAVFVHGLDISCSCAIDLILSVETFATRRAENVCDSCDQARRGSCLNHVSAIGPLSLAFDCYTTLTNLLGVLLEDRWGVPGCVMGVAGMSGMTLYSVHLFVNCHGGCTQARYFTRGVFTVAAPCQAHSVRVQAHDSSCMSTVIPSKLVWFLLGANLVTQRDCASAGPSLLHRTLRPVWIPTRHWPICDPCSYC